MEVSNWFVIILMLWIDPLIRRGARAPLSEADVWKICRCDSAVYLHGAFSNHWQTELTTDKPSFGRAMWRTLRKPSLVVTCLYFAYTGLMLLQPTIIKSLLQLLSSEMDDTDTAIGIRSGYVLAGLLAGLSFVSVTLMDYGHSLTVRLGANAKSIVLDTIYMKTLALGSSSSFSSGDIVTLSTVDSERLFAGYFTGPWVVVAPVTLGVIFILISIDLGLLAGLLGGATMLVMLYIASRLAAVVGGLRREIASVQATRVQLTHEIIHGVRVVKMHGWSSLVHAKVEAIRATELRLIRRYQCLKVVNDAALSMAPVLSLTVCLAIYVSQGNSLNPPLAFTALAYINVARLPCTVFSGAITSATEALASCDRIGAFLLADEVDTLAVPEPGIAGDNGPLGINLVDATFSWTTAEAHLHAIDLAIPSTPSLTIIVGSVGSGKSSLMSAIAGEMHTMSGVRSVRGTMGYCSQDVWLEQSTIRNNVLFHDVLDSQRYHDVLAACQLIPDLANLPQGDATEIGERGITLSGGQKARVSLARALYRSFTADLFLLDDPLSALDVHVANAVFHQGIRGLLGTKTVLLVVNSHYHLLPFADRVIVMENGRIVGNGSYAAIADTFPHLASTSTDDVDRVHSHASSSLAKSASTNDATTDLIDQEECAVGAVTKQTYLAYFNASGWNPFLVMVTILTAFAAAQTSLVFMDWYMGHWAATSAHNSATVSVAIYSLLALLSILLLCGRSIYVLFVSVLCSQRLHHTVLGHVLSAPVPTFFDVTPVGRILNRFSSDLDQIDTLVPQLVIFCLQFSIQTLAVIVVCALTSPYILLLYVPIAAAFVQIQAYFNQTAAALKRLDSVTRSPLLISISEAVAGLATIRVFGKTSIFLTENRSKIDHAQTFFLLHRTLYRWLEMRLDWLCTLIVAGVAFLCVATKASIGITAAGLGLTYATQMSVCLSRLVIGYSLMDNLMTCVERMEHYKGIEAEGTLAESSVDKRTFPDDSLTNWPPHGAIEFKSYWLRYRASLDFVLRNISISIAPGEKVGICGRTGAGKSSLAAALFRMVEAASGSIEIDGVDIAQLDLHTLRSRLTIIPQDPVLFTGSLRFNMDPTNESSDADLWTVLKRVHLDASFESGLDFQVAAQGSNLSVGQRQLLCIARALLRSSRVVVLDEATAKIDLESDKAIQQAIQEWFCDVTMLTIAHRLDTIMQSDRILVLDQGRVCEFDAPQTLLGDENGVFSSLVKQSNL